MKHITCDPDRVQKYLDAHLSDKECSALESHALSCETCQAQLEAGLSGMQAAFRSTFPPEDVPEAIRQRVASVTEPGRLSFAGWRWGWIGGMGLATAAALAWFVFVGRVPTALVVEGTVAVYGRTYLPGESVPLDGKLVSTDKAVLQYQNATLKVGEAWSETHSTIRDGEPQLEVIRGSILATDKGPAPRYALLAGGIPIHALGTRFQVSTATIGKPFVAVYQDAVEVGEGRLPVRVSTGSTRDLAKSTQGYIDDDPTAIEPGQLVPVPTAAGLVEMPFVPTTARKLPADVARNLTELSKKLSLSDGSATLYLQIAAELLKAGEIRNAALAARGALDSPQTLSVAPTGLRSQVALGIMPVDPEASGTLLLRAGKELVNWGHIAKVLADAKVARKDQKQRRVDEAIRLGVSLMDRATTVDEKFCLGSCLLGFGQTRPDELALSTATNLLRECAKSPELTQRQQAIAYQRLGEALFYSPDRPEENLEATRKAYELWPRPDWAANLASRLCEDGDAAALQASGFTEVYELIRTALTGAPSYGAYERALSLMRIIADSERDWDEIREISNWLVNTYSAVSEAKILAAGDLIGFGEYDSAYKMMAGALRERNGDIASLGGHRINWAILLHKQGFVLKALEAITAVVPKAETTPEPRYLEGAWSYFVAIGEFGEALRNHTRPPQDGQHEAEFASWQADQARLLAACGKRFEAVGMTIDFLKNPRSVDIPFEVAKAYLRLAELMKESNPDLSRQYAEKLLRYVEGKPFRSGWMGLQREDRPLRARALFVLGKRKAAEDELELYIMSWPGPAQARAETDRLKSWQESGR